MRLSKIVATVLLMMFGIGSFISAFVYAPYSYNQTVISQSKWPATPGTVISKRYFADNDGCRWVNIEFAYEVGGINYSSDQELYAGPYSVTQHSYYSPGQVISIYYNPMNPAKAVVDRRFADSYRMPDFLIYILLLAGGPVLAIVSLGLLWK